MQEIKIGLENNVDVTLYNNPIYTNKQMREIRLGLEKGLNVSYYASSEFDYQQMVEISRGLEQGLDIEIYLNPNISAHEMEINRQILLRESKYERNTMG